MNKCDTGHYPVFFMRSRFFGGTLVFRQQRSKELLCFHMSLYIAGAANQSLSIVIDHPSFVRLFKQYADTYV